MIFAWSDVFVWAIYTWAHRHIAITFPVVTFLLNLIFGLLLFWAHCFCSFLCVFHALVTKWRCSDRSSEHECSCVVPVFDFLETWFRLLPMERNGCCTYLNYIAFAHCTKSMGKFLCWSYYGCLFWMLFLSTVSFRWTVCSFYSSHWYTLNGITANAHVVACNQLLTYIRSCCLYELFWRSHLDLLHVWYDVNNPVFLYENVARLSHVIGVLFSWCYPERSTRWLHRINWSVVLFKCGALSRWQ